MREMLAAVFGVITFILLFIGGWKIIQIEEWSPSTYVDAAFITFMITLLLLQHGKDSNQK
jgi:hypothetical protein